MNERIEHLLKRIKELQEELHLELAELAKRFRYTIEQRKVIFELEVAEYHRRLKANLYQYIINTRLSALMTAPFLYAMLVPLMIFDLWLTACQAVFFPIYGIKKVPRGDFIVLDRHYLNYLNIFERMSCAYCGYANGVFAYAREIGARAENYWCPIKHARRIHDEHSLYGGFEEYGNAEGFRERMYPPDAAKKT